ncbi:hypothetical protein [Loktanella sp. Alg231-35]|uniref:hypothetical protein n=1 Tax=Loktanella sp. Alg231-35 TaxID=1922220 RepID=UPI000D55F8AA|nr:hypothetical protein [Loktanella sp. Alg231-35]
MPNQWTSLQLASGDLELVILPGIGGRIWDVVFQGKSLLFQNPDLLGIQFDIDALSELPTRSPQFGFPLWGGEKTWIAPDTSWQDGGPFATLDSGPYQVVSQDVDHVVLESAICPHSHLSAARRITVASPTRWNIEHTVTNHGTKPRMTGIWSVMMINTPAKIGVAMDNPATHTVFGHAESLISATTNCVIANCAEQQEFKVGLANPYGETLIKNDETGTWMMCSTPKLASGDVFAHGQPVEIFNSGDYPYCEAEWHSPARDLGPDQSMQYRQDFEIGSADAPTSYRTQKELVTCMS